MSSGCATAAAESLSQIKRHLRALDQNGAADFFCLGSFDRLLKSTISLCPECLAHIPGLVYTRQHQVWMRKRCALHGDSDALLESDEHFYHLSNKDQWGRRYSAE